MATYISYQTPPGYPTRWGMRQHVMFGRDVLANHAGTCIELAILYASACETAGLEPFLITISGHAYPAVLVKDRNNKPVAFLPVETTMIGRYAFQDAVKKGLAEYKEVEAGKDAVITNISTMRVRGVSPLDLPAVEADWLNKVCPPKKMRQPPRTTASRSIVGTWGSRYRDNSTNTMVTQKLIFGADQAMASYWVYGDGSQTESAGTYEYANGILSTSTNLGKTSGQIEWIDDNTFRFINANYNMVFHRIR
jgi:hypothetical protein